MKGCLIVALSIILILIAIGLCLLSACAILGAFTMSGLTKLWLILGAIVCLSLVFLLAKVVKKLNNAM